MSLASWQLLQLLQFWQDKVMVVSQNRVSRVIFFHILSTRSSHIFFTIRNLKNLYYTFSFLLLPLTLSKPFQSHFIPSFSLIYSQTASCRWSSRFCCYVVRTTSKVPDLLHLCNYYFIVAPRRFYLAFTQRVPYLR